MQNNQNWLNEETAAYPSLRQRRGKRNILIVVGAILVVVIIAVGITLLVSNATKSACLGADEYAELTDNPYDASTTNIQENFYSFPIQFLPGTTKFDDTEQPKNSAILGYMGEFYKKHSDKEPIFTLIATRNDPEDWYLGQDRLDIAKQALLRGGVPENSIVTQPIVSEIIDESDYDSEADGPILDNEDIDADTLTLRITSAKQCTQ